MMDQDVFFAVSTPDELRSRQHPNFAGDREHLRAFIKLASSPIRSDERQDSLTEWVAYRRRPAARKVAWQNRILNIDLSGANLKQIALGTADLRLCSFDSADMRGSSFKAALFQRSTFRRADLRNARLMYADFRSADLSHCDLRDADLSGANLSDARLVGARLNGANLEFAQLVKSDLSGADLRGSRVYGAGVWNVEMSAKTRQQGLVVEEPYGSRVSKITVNGCDVAQFAHLFLDPGKIFEIMSTTTDKLVLILGRFSKSRKSVLDEIRRRLPDYDQVGIMFDFDFLDQRTMLETVLTLSQMSRFTLADLTGARLVVHEVEAILERLSGQIVQPVHSSRSRDIPRLREIGESSRNIYLPTITYKNKTDMIEKIPTEILPAVERAARELEARDKFTPLRDSP
jgi:uncharacterized protein YjbI with pentapeptide repeats